MTETTLFEQLLDVEIVKGPEFTILHGRLYMTILCRRGGQYFAPLLDLSSRAFGDAAPWVAPGDMVKTLRDTREPLGQQWADWIEGSHDD